jgi:hypothetical protein
LRWVLGPAPANDYEVAALASRHISGHAGAMDDRESAP